MKSLIFSLLCIFCFTVSNAQQKTTDKAVISTPGVQCGMCKDRIENRLSKEDGITSVKVDIKKKTTAVVWVTDRTNIENIKTFIANLGYDAEDITAEPDAYKRLPGCCKKKVEDKPAAIVQ